MTLRLLCRDAQAFDHRVGRVHGFRSRRSRNHRDEQAHFGAGVDDRRDARPQSFGGVRQPPEAVGVLDGQLFGARGVAAQEDFGCGALIRDERRIESAVLDRVVAPGERDRALAGPEAAADGEELVGALVPPVVRQKVAVVLLFFWRVASDDVQADAPSSQDPKSC